MPVGIDAQPAPLPFPQAFFDAAVSYDSYHYFGTDECYLPLYASLVKPGGLLGIVSPGRRIEPESDPDGFHGPDWWRRHWEITGRGDVVVDHADMLPHGHEEWLQWARIVNQDAGNLEDAYAVAMLRADTQHSLGFTRIAAHRSITN